MNGCAAFSAQRRLLQLPQTQEQRSDANGLCELQACPWWMLACHCTGQLHRPSTIGLPDQHAASQPAAVSHSQHGAMAAIHNSCRGLNIKAPKSHTEDTETAQASSSLTCGWPPDALAACCSGGAADWAAGSAGTLAASVVTTGASAPVPTLVLEPDTTWCDCAEESACALRTTIRFELQSDDRAIQRHQHSAAH